MTKISKPFLNKCDDCKYIGEQCLWKIEGYEGLIHIKEYFKVYPEYGDNPKYFDLNMINAKLVSKKYKISEDKIEKLIMNGEPCCPKCKSLKFFHYDKEVVK